MLRQGIMLLTRFCQDNRVQVRQPQRNLQVKFTRQVAGKSDFVSYVDAIGKLDGKRCLLEWKTSSSRYPEEPEGLLSLDPQLVCYSWITGIADVAQVVFVRKKSSRSSVPADHNHRRTTRRVWPLGGETRSVESSRRSFCRTAESASPKTLAVLARMWACVLVSRK